jgi:MFS family permease
MTTSTAPSTGIFALEYRWTTIGAVALIFLAAFESLAVTTIMPIISRELDGESLYAVAFSGMLAASVIGMVAAGRWADRTGPAGPLVTAIAVFVLGLVLSGAATDMVVFIVGRILQGLGSGAVTVALYVVVARIYPATLHPKIFGAFAAAWVVPSLVGPPVAGVVADGLSWHWVFLGVGVLALVAGAAIVPALRILRGRARDSSTSPGRSDTSGWMIFWAVVLAAAVIAISIGGELDSPLAWPLAATAFVVVVIALRPLVPRGTLSVRRGLPAVVLLRGALAATFFATEVYLPYLLNASYNLPTWAAGLILTVGAVSWAGGSAVQARLGDRVASSTIARIGVLVLAIGIAVQFFTAFLVLPPIVAAIGWFVAGGGMGLVYPRISTLVLAYSTPRDQGFNSAAMSITDAAGGAVAIAFAGLVFTAFGAVVGGGFTAALALTTAIALAAVPVAFRVRESITAVKAAVATQ